MKEFWKILGIAETRDPIQIKNAYRTKLTSVNPEDDPEGFKQLRSAYEAAVSWAETPAEEAQEDLTEAGIWIRKVKGVYECFLKRIQKSCWQELLAADICIGLDTWDEARDRLLDFLTDHYRLPHEIFKLLDSHFHLTEDAAELCERYPKNFVDYLVSVCSHPGLIDYQLFEGPDEGDYDQYIDLYHQMKAVVDAEEEIPENLAAEIAALSIYHPYLEVEQIRFLLVQNQLEEALKRMEVLSGQYPADDYIKYYCARVYWEQKNYEGAYRIFQELIDKIPNHFSAKMGIAQYYQQTGQFMEAKEAFIDVLEMDSQNQAALAGMREANENLIVFYQESLAEKPEDQDAVLELGWCLFQNEKYQEAIDLLDQVSPDPDHQFQYHNLKGRTYLGLEDYQNARNHLEQWLHAIKALAEDGTEETQKRKRRLGYAYYTIASCFIHSDEGSEEANTQKALAFLDLAVDAEKELGQQINYLNAKSGLLLKKARYQESAEVCDQMLALDERYFPAYVTRQEAYYHMEYYQNVIDDYYNATDIYPYYAPLYLLAVKTFWLYREYESGLKVIGRAEENKIINDELRLYQIKFMRGLARTNEDSMEAYQLCQELKERQSAEDFLLEKVSDLYYESAVCLMDAGRSKQALEEINEAIRLDPADDSYLYIKANIYMRLSEYQQALSIYRLLDEKRPGNGLILNRLGEALEGLSKVEEAIEYFEKALAADPEQQTVNHNLMKCYRGLWHRLEESAYFEKAMKYMNQQLKLKPDAYYYIERGLLYLAADAFAEAADDFLKALELEPHNLYAYNNLGTVYARQGRYEAAVEQLLKAAEEMEGAVTMLPYRMLGYCYLQLQEFEKSLASYRKNLELFADEPSAYRDLARYYTTTGAYREALAVYVKGKELPNADKRRFMRWIGETYENLQDDKEAVKIYRDLIRSDESDVEAYRALGDFLFRTKEQYRNALKQYQQALTYTRPDDIDSDYGSLCSEIGECYYYAGKSEKAKLYLEKALKFYERGNKSTAVYVSYPGYRLARYYKIFTIHYYLGDIMAAKACLQKMDELPMCRGCLSYGCYERLMAQALIAKAENRPEAAGTLLQEALVLDPTSAEIKFLQKQLTKKKRWGDWL